jgi:hypothetical protein
VTLPAESEGFAARLGRASAWLGRRPDVVAHTLLVLLPFVFMWDFVLERQYLWYFDFTLQWLPWQKFVIDSLSRGDAPFWNPYLMLGFPQAAESQVGMFYPVNILTAWLDLRFRLVVILCLHLILANVSMYLLLRHMRLGRVPAFLGAISYGLSGYMFAQATNYVITQGSGYLPLMILLLTLYFERRRFLELGLFGLCVALHLTISHAGTTFMILGGTALYFIVQALRSGHWVRDLALYGAAVALGVLFASVQVFPILELKPLSERSAPMSFEYVTNSAYTAGLQEKLSFFFPWMLGDSRAGRSMAYGFEEVHQYAGAFVPVLAVLAVARWKDFDPGQRRFLWAVAVAGGVAFLLSFGDKFPLISPWAVLYKLPGFSMFRIPARWGCIFTFGLSVLAAFGLQALQARPAPLRTLLVWAVGLPVIAVVAAVLQEGLDPIASVFAEPRRILDAPTNAFESWIVEPLSEQSPVLLYVLLVAPFLLTAWAFQRGWLTAHRFALALASLLTLDLFLVESPLNPRTTDISFLQMRPKETHFQGDKQYCRVAPSRDTKPPLIGFPFNTPAYFGIFSASGDTPLELAKFMQLERHLKRKEVLDYIGVCYDRSLRLRDTPLPRAFVVSDVRSAGNGDPLEQFLKLDAESMKSTVFLDAKAFAEVAPALGSRRESPEQSVAIERFENDLIDLDVKTSAPGLLVMTDTVYPGWSATLDARPTPLHAAQGIFRAVAVPEGSHRVRFEYQANAIRWGAACSGLSLLGFALAVAVPRLRRSRRSPSN